MKNNLFGLLLFQPNKITINTNADNILRNNGKFIIAIDKLNLGEYNVKLQGIEQMFCGWKIR